MIDALPSVSETKMRKRTIWSAEERDMIKQHLLPIVQKLSKPPSKKDIMNEDAIAPLLKRRDWKAIKYQAWAMYQHKQRKRDTVIKELFSQ